MWLTSAPRARTRRTACWIGPKVEPQPTTASLPLMSPSDTSCSGMKFAMPSILALRVSVIFWWLAGS